MMSEPNNNLSFSLHEIDDKGKEEEGVTYSDLVQQVDYMEMCSTVAMDDYIAQEVEYQTNYTKKELDKIAEYYEINKRKSRGTKKKQELMEDIVFFEKATENVEIVYRRKKLWSYIEEIKADKYLSKYLIFE